MGYSEKLKEMVYMEYKNFTPCIQALEDGSVFLGRYLQDSIPNDIDRRSDLIGDELNAYIISSVERIWRREDIYHQWMKEMP